MHPKRTWEEAMTLNDAYSEWKAKGFFHFLYYYLSQIEVEVEFLPSGEFANTLDMEYHGNRSGSKIVSCLIDRFYDADFFDAIAVGIAETFWNLNGVNLVKLYEVYEQQYNPIDNYNMTETNTDHHTGNDTRKLSGSVTDTTTGKMRTTNSVQGLDSVTYKDSERSETEYNPDSSEGMKSVKSYSDDYSDKLTYNSQVTSRKTRSGNVGVTTTQQMLKSEIDLWKWNFYDEMFRLADKLVTIPVY